MSKISMAKQIAYNVSKLLDTLLEDYDNSLRPEFGGRILQFIFDDDVNDLEPGSSISIEANMQVRSMGPISEVDMVRPSAY